MADIDAIIELFNTLSVVIGSVEQHPIQLKSQNILLGPGNIAQGRDVFLQNTTDSRGIALIEHPATECELKYHWVNRDALSGVWMIGELVEELKYIS